MRPHHFLLSSSRAISGTVYGTIVAMSVLAAGSTPGQIDPGRLAGLVASSAIVFWLAHVYSDALEESIEAKTRLTARELTAIARRESAIPLAAVAPTVALVLGAAGIFGESTSAWIAMGLGVGTLGLEGARYATIERLGLGRALLVVAANLALGLLIVVLKATLAH